MSTNIIERAPTEEDWLSAGELASTQFEETHEFPNMATEHDREDWEESATVRILIERGFNPDLP